MDNTDYVIWVPERDGHAPRGWKDGMRWIFQQKMQSEQHKPGWFLGYTYRVPPEAIFDYATWRAEGLANKLPDGVVLPEPTDWAMEVAYEYAHGGKSGLHGLAELIRTHCQPREVSNGGRISEERDANTRLIRAAPELLAACQAVAASALRNEAYDLCVAAIAKATKP